VPRKRKRKKTSSCQHGAVTWRRYKLDHGCIARKSKQSAVTTMMQQVHNQYQPSVATKTAEATVTKAKKKRKAKPKKAKENDTRRPAEIDLQDTSNTPEVAKEMAIYLCGC
jgi:multidrug resistance efflux pump